MCRHAYVHIIRFMCYIGKVKGLDIYCDQNTSSCCMDSVYTVVRPMQLTLL